MSRVEILRAEGLSKTFMIKNARLFERSRPLAALRGISFSLYEGETLGIIGESGCGKSTLGKVIMGIHRATTGDLYYRGKSILGKSRRERKALYKDIQIIFQDPYSSLDPRQTAASSIEEPMIIHGLGNRMERQTRVRELLDLVGLNKFHARRFPHEFSGGQRQRINIARTLALKPRVIICDEPVSALDVSVQAQVLNLIKELQGQFGLTYLFISHDLSVVKYMSDRIAIMYLGKIVELGGSAEIYRNPLHPYTQALFDAIPPDSPFEKKTERPLEGEVPSPFNIPPGCPFSSRCPRAVPACVVEEPPLRDVGDGHLLACIVGNDS
ncbi:MAG: ATP-binding cassette domain-containing protein [Treponema sp.]|jgi:oligopeptide/dipeptide ABC transporter ATP-binding protein|nr:ATP-binding cassette domain-containing protein [Treponema sp.]